MFGLGTTELILILVITLIIFGAGKLPQIGEALGKGIKNFKRATDDKENKSLSTSINKGAQPSHPENHHE